MITWLIFSEQYRSFSPSLCSLFYSPLTSFQLRPNIFFSTPFSNSLSLWFSIIMRDQVSHPYETTGKNIDPYKIHKYTEWSECKTCWYIKQTQGFKWLMSILILLSCSQVGAPSFLLISGFAVILDEFLNCRMCTKYSCYLIVLSSIFQIIFL
jgi:hypothetical protein